MSDEESTVAVAAPSGWQDEQRRHEALAFAVGLGSKTILDPEEVVGAAEKFHAFLAGEDSAKSEEIAPPTEPGFYKYSGGRNLMVFLLSNDGQWYTWFDNGEAHECAWGYIEQALGVWDLVKI